MRTLPHKTIAVIGSSGFVGGAIAATLASEPDIVVRRVRSPRLRTGGRMVGALVDEARRSSAAGDVARQLTGVEVLVNAAGNPDASSLDEDALFGANALLPRVVLEAAARAGVQRLVHVSSAVVQNDRPVLDATEEVLPFSPYSASKVAGEQVLREIDSGVEVIRFRPPSVHARGRRVTRMIARIASSPIASVARPGSQPTPQALLPNVAAAVAFLATTELVPPSVVIHPSEGVTVSSLMQALGGKRPIRLPRWFVSLVVAVLRTLGRVHAPTAANARRVELLWIGQAQAESWLTQMGWIPPVGQDGWKRLANTEIERTGEECGF